MQLVDWGGQPAAQALAAPVTDQGGDGQRRGRQGREQKAMQGLGLGLGSEKLGRGRGLKWHLRKWLSYFEACLQKRVDLPGRL